MIPHRISETSSCAIVMPQSSQKIIGILLPLLFVFGCHTPLAVKQMQANNPLAKNSAKNPVEIVDVWNSCAQTSSDGKIMRGMAGRIHFYDNRKKRQSVKVDGDVTVYVFDGNDTDPAHTKPIKVFEFKSDTLDQYHSRQKNLGHGYDFFLPIDEIGGEEKSLCLMVRFDNKLNDSFIPPKPTNTLLAGRKPPTPTEPSIREFLDSRSILAEANQNITTAFDSSAVQQVAYITEKQGNEPVNSKVSTIPLNGDMTRRLLESNRE